jgi:hypothetical protein
MGRRLPDAHTAEGTVRSMSTENSGGQAWEALRTLAGATKGKHSNARSALVDGE